MENRVPRPQTEANGCLSHTFRFTGSPCSRTANLSQAFTRIRRALFDAHRADSATPGIIQWRLDALLTRDRGGFKASCQSARVASTQGGQMQRSIMRIGQKKRIGLVRL